MSIGVVAVARCVSASTSAAQSRSTHHAAQRANDPEALLTIIYIVGEAVAPASGTRTHYSGQGRSVKRKDLGGQASEPPA